MLTPAGSHSEQTRIEYLVRTSVLFTNRSHVSLFGYVLCKTTVLKWYCRKLQRELRFLQCLIRGNLPSLVQFNISKRKSCFPPPSRCSVLTILQRKIRCRRKSALFAPSFPKSHCKLLNKLLK